MIRNNVVLPDPDGPVIVVISPWWAVKLTLCSTRAFSPPCE
jgi:hypothetical protein